MLELQNYPIIILMHLHNFNYLDNIINGNKYERSSFIYIISICCLSANETFITVMCRYSVQQCIHFM